MSESPEPETQTPTPRKPRRPTRHNEWDREKMTGFLRELAASQNVRQASKSVGMSHTAAYRLRNKLRGTPFDLGWEVALEAGFSQLAQAVMDRALNGEEITHYHKGEVVGTSRRYDNYLARWILENPWKVGRHQVAREYVTEGFERLLERIEAGALDWVAGDALPGTPHWEDDENPAAAAARQDAFAKEKSWYAAEARTEHQRLLPARLRGQAG